MSCLTLGKGRLLYGNTRVIATKTGEPPKGLEEGVDYDAVITTSEMARIRKEACESYIQKYGKDPVNPKLDNISGTLLPVEEVQRLVNKGVLAPSD